MTPDTLRCSHLTRRGRPCRNPAAPGSDPPACAMHRRVTSDEFRVTSVALPRATQPYLPGLAPATAVAPTSDVAPTSVVAHLYLTQPAAGELRALAASAAGQDLQPEIDLTRVVLRRLMAYLDEAAEALSPEEARRIAGLLFTGARTVALLQGKRPARPAETQDWLAAALGEMGEELGREL